MSKTVKKILIFLAILIVIVIAVVLIQILLTSKQAGDPSPSPSASVSATPDETASASPSDIATPSTPAPTDSGTIEKVHTIDGTQFTITVPGDFLTFSIVADEAALTFGAEHGVYTFSSNEITDMLLMMTFIVDGKATSLAPSFLDAYMNYTSFEQSGLSAISGTDIAGEMIAASNDEVTMTAWLVDMQSGVLAVVIQSPDAVQLSVLPELEKAVASIEIIAQSYGYGS